jgi:uncharacterized coiled-coil protein SlyX
MQATAAEDTKAQERTAQLEEKAEQCDRAIAFLQGKFAQLSADIGRLAGGMRALSDEVSAQKTHITAKGLSAECAESRNKVSALKAKAGAISAPSPAPAPASNRPPATTPVKVPVPGTSSRLLTLHRFGWRNDAGIARGSSAANSAVGRGRNRRKLNKQSALLKCILQGSFNS